MHLDFFQQLPLRRCVISEWPVSLEGKRPAWISRDQYLELLDETGRHLVAGKRGAIPPHVATILERLDIQADAWFVSMRRGNALPGSALGGLVQRQAEAARRGLRWLANRCSLFAGPMIAPQTG